MNRNLKTRHVHLLRLEDMMAGKTQRYDGATSSNSPSSPSTCLSHFWSSALRSKTLTSPSLRTHNADALLRRLTLFDLLLIGVGASIGAGIFVITGTVARDAGPGPALNYPCLYWITYLELENESKVTYLKLEIELRSQNLYERNDLLHDLFLFRENLTLVFAICFKMYVVLYVLTYFKSLNTTVQHFSMG